jgi:hypothetical protein
MLMRFILRKPFSLIQQDLQVQRLHLTFYPSHKGTHLFAIGHGIVMSFENYYTHFFFPILLLQHID